MQVLGASAVSQWVVLLSFQLQSKHHSVKLVKVGPEDRGLFHSATSPGPELTQLGLCLVPQEGDHPLSSPAVTHP